MTISAIESAMSGLAARHNAREARRINPATGTPALGEVIRFARSPAGPGYLEVLTPEEMAGVEPGAVPSDFGYLPRHRLYVRGWFVGPGIPRP